MVLWVCYTRPRPAGHRRRLRGLRRRWHLYHHGGLRPRLVGGRRALVQGDAESEQRHPFSATIQSPHSLLKTKDVRAFKVGWADATFGATKGDLLAPASAPRILVYPCDHYSLLPSKKI